MSCNSYRAPHNFQGSVPNANSRYARRNSAARNSSGGIPGMVPGQLYTLSLKGVCGVPADATCITIEEVKCSALPGNRGSVFRLVVHNYQSITDASNTPCLDVSGGKGMPYTRGQGGAPGQLDPNGVDAAYNFDANGNQLHAETNCPIAQVSGIRPAANGTLGAFVTIKNNHECLTLYATFSPQSGCCNPCDGTSNPPCGWQGPSAADGCGCCPCPCSCPGESTPGESPPAENA